MLDSMSTAATTTTSELKQKLTTIQPTQQTSSFISLPIQDILDHKQNSYKMPPDRTIYETSLIYCDLCDYSCDIDNKNAIISHYIAKHPSQNIVYNYLWSQLENEAGDAISSGTAAAIQQAAATAADASLKMKYYLIKAHLKVRYKENDFLTNDASLVDEHHNETSSDVLNGVCTNEISKLEETEENIAIKNECMSVLNIMLAKISGEEGVQEIEVEQEVHEVQERDIFQNTDYQQQQQQQQIVETQVHTEQHIIIQEQENVVPQQEQEQQLYLLQQQQQQQQQQVQQQAQQEECGENLFVFKCNLCDTYNTDDLTQLLEHYKLLHNVELSVSDSSILLTAAIAAFQTGHTIEMTGAILNTISTVTNENGLTIINGEELPVHTTVQYKCTLCYEIFYEKIFIVQHLRDMHQFEVDISYFEAIEMQQQEQLQQKLFEQEQEQLQLVAQQQQQQQQLLQQQQQQVTVDNTQQQYQVAAAAAAQQQQTMQIDDTNSILLQSVADNTASSVVPTTLIATIMDDQLLQATATTTTTTTAPSVPLTNVGNKSSTTRYSCNYCAFGSDQLKKIGLHLKKTHANKELTCMDHVKNQIIKVFDEALSASSNSGTPAMTMSPQTTIDAILSATSTSASSNNLLLLTPNNTTTTTTATNGGGGGRKRNSNSSTSSSSSLNKWATTNAAVTDAHNKKTETPSHPIPNDLTQLFLDGNNQLLIDFNENDDLNCCYCEYCVSGLNSMRTHIKLKHKDKRVIFRNKKNYKLYHIVNDSAPLIVSDTSSTPVNNKVIKKEADSLLQQHQQQQQDNSQLQLNEETMKMYSHLNITLNCHYCWAQFQLNASKNPKENGNNKFMQHLNLHLNAPYLCGECLYPVRDYKTFLKHKEFYKHDETAAITKSTKCEMIENKVYKHLLNEKVKRQQEQLSSLQQSQHQLSINDLNFKYKCSQCLKYSNDKDELIKHILIVHLAFLAYKCDICTYYTFDEQQLRQHGLQVHKLSECKYKLIKTEEEINLALNKANQLIIQLNNNSSPSSNTTTGTSVDANASSICDVVPKYKCCKCATSSDYSAGTGGQQQQATILFSYQDALEHIIRLHLNHPAASQPLAPATNKQLPTQNQTQNKKVCHELELLEETLENLKDKNLLSQTTTITSSITPQLITTGGTKRKFDQLDTSVTATDALNNSSGDLLNANSDTLENFDLLEDDYYIDDTDELSWSLLEYMPQPQAKQSRKFYYKTYLIYKCKLCDRKFNHFNLDHWLDCHNTQVKSYSCVKCTNAQAPAVAATTTNNKQTAYNSLYELYFHIKNQHHLKQPTTTSQLTCFICASEIKAGSNSLLASVFEQHLLAEHSIVDSQSEFNDLTLQFIQVLQLLNYVQVYQYVKKSKKLMFNDYFLYLNDLKFNSKELKGAEISKLNEIYQQQIQDKSILSWLNVDQLVIRNFNINSYACSICGMSKEKILKSYLSSTAAAVASTSVNNQQQQALNPNLLCTSLLCNDTDETILIVTNHILQHFNEYCYRCIACKISWPDRTQLLKHSQECPNSQVVRTKTKYKLKANFRLYLQFNLLSYTNYWQNEFERYSVLINEVEQEQREEHEEETTTATTATDKYKKLKLNKSKIYLNDLFLNDKKFLLLQSSNYNLNKINLDDNGNCFMLEDDDSYN